jgi:hypothetical protein
MAAGSEPHSIEMDELGELHWIIKTTDASVLADLPPLLEEAGKDVARASSVLSVTIAQGEISVILPAGHCDALCAKHPSGIQKSGPYALLRVRGPLDFALVGIMAGMTQALASAKISVLALSTYDTDFLCVGASAVEGAAAALRRPELANGMRIVVNRQAAAHA